MEAEGALREQIHPKKKRQKNDKPRKADVNTHLAEAAVREKKTKSQNNNRGTTQMAPPEKEKQCHPTSPTMTECVVSSVVVSESEEEPPRQTEEVPTPSEVAETER